MTRTSELPDGTETRASSALARCRSICAVSFGSVALPVRFLGRSNSVMFCWCRRPKAPRITATGYAQAPANHPCAVTMAGRDGHRTNLRAATASDLIGVSVRMGERKRRDVYGGFPFT